MDAHANMDDKALVAEIAAGASSLRLTVAAAESCTGGLIAAALTSVGGASAWFRGGVVSYSPELKSEWLGVPPELISAKGAVSEGVALAMAEGARRRAAADIAVSSTGLAGPDGDPEHPELPVGTVFIGVATPRGSRAVRCVFSGGRSEVRARAVSRALKELASEIRIPAV